MLPEVVLFNQILSWLVFFSNLFSVVVIVALIFKRTDIFQKLLGFLKKYAYTGSLLFALGGVLGSVVYSEFVGLEPCFLCWVQRIFLYPIAILLIIALIKKEKVITDYILSLSAIGSLIALYHSYLQWSGAASSVFCSGSSVDCSIVYFTELGYINLPFMAFSAFVLITLLMLVEKFFQK